MYVPSKKLCVGAGGACWEGDDGADFTQVTHEGLKSARASKEKGGFHQALCSVLYRIWVTNSCQDVGFL